MIGYDEFRGGIGHLSAEDHQFCLGYHLSWMSQSLGYTILLVFQLGWGLLYPDAHCGLMVP